MSFAGVAINSSLSKAGRAAVYIGAPVSGFSSMGQTLYSVGSVEGTVSVSPNQDVVKLYRSDAQNPCHVLETAYDFQVSFNLQEADLYNLALSLGYKTSESISASDSLVSSTTAITQGDIFGGTLFAPALTEQKMGRMTLDISEKKIIFDLAAGTNGFISVTNDDIMVITDISESLSTGINTIEITNQGGAYSAGTLSATGGGGSGFAGTYTVNSGNIDSVAITNPGSGYHNQDNDLAIVTSDAGNGNAVLKPHIANIRALEDVQLPVTSDNADRITTDVLDDDLFDAVNSSGSTTDVIIQPHNLTYGTSGFDSVIQDTAGIMGKMRRLVDVTQYSSNNPGAGVPYATTVEFTSATDNFDNINEVGEYIVLTSTDDDNLKPLLGYPLRVTVGESLNKITVDVSDFEVPKSITLTNTDTYADSLIKLQLGSDFQAGYRSLLIRVEGGNNSVGGGNTDGESAVDEWQFWKVKIQSTGSIDYDRTGAVTLPVTLHCVANSSDVVGQYISANDTVRSGSYGDS